ncbi:hypothetical protein K504DRAFT_296755 [Pleomassaria siparia CBS 279.74]|uniref:Uncharacterized protein n=1 Tax=Pleomassaria siparia CBS 279.74 TaxID=1314801 RepID=A0A6G1K524_9PLEO|nr:hypothetical protein K504DRAFT_296755 [Pleomassaria siparia CBS 279.74]
MARCDVFINRALQMFGSRWRERTKVCGMLNSVHTRDTVRWNCCGLAVYRHIGISAVDKHKYLLTPEAAASVARHPQALQAGTRLGEELFTRLTTAAYTPIFPSLPSRTIPTPRLLLHLHLLWWVIFKLTTTVVPGWNASTSTPQSPPTGTRP